MVCKLHRQENAIPYKQWQLIVLLIRSFQTNNGSMIDFLAYFLFEYSFSISIENVEIFTSVISLRSIRIIFFISAWFYKKKHPLPIFKLNLKFS